jgi:ankyrin repeat protein
VAPEERAVKKLVVTLWLASSVLAPTVGAATGDPLVEAAAAGDMATVRRLVRQGHDVNAAGLDGATALHWAVRAEDDEAVAMLVAAGARVSTANALGITPVYVAAAQGSVAIVRRLLDAGASVEATDPTGDTLLMATVRAGALEAATLLLDRGAAVNATEPELGHTALMWAVRENHSELVRLLLSRGATIEARTRVGAKLAARPPGAGGGSHGVGIVRGGVPPQGEQLPTPGGMTPLLFAARGGLLDATRQLVAAKASLSAADPNGVTPLLMAITNGHVAVAEFLVESGADVRAADWWGRTPLWAAVEIRNLDVRSGVTDNGIDREAALRLVDALLAKGAEVNARVKEFPPQRRHMLPLGSLEWVDFTGQTPFIRAAQSADVTVMRRLLAKGADPAITTFHGTTALMAAAGVNWVAGQTFSESPASWLDAVRLALEVGGEPNAVNEMGLAAIHGAANRGSNDIIELLVARGARVEVADKEGRTPLTWAEGVFLATNSPVAKPSTIALLRRLATTPAGIAAPRP